MGRLEREEGDEPRWGQAEVYRVCQADAGEAWSQARVISIHSTNLYLLKSFNPHFLCRFCSFRKFYILLNSVCDPHCLWCPPLLPVTHAMYFICTEITLTPTCIYPFFSTVTLLLAERKCLILAWSSWRSRPECSSGWEKRSSATGTSAHSTSVFMRTFWAIL